MSDDVTLLCTRTNDDVKTNIMMDDPQSANPDAADESASGSDASASSSSTDPAAESERDPFGRPSGDPFGGDSFEGPSDGGRSFDASGGSGSRTVGSESAGFAYEMAKMWVQDHQKEAMVGAFAAGVFLGALLRD